MNRSDAIARRTVIGNIAGNLACSRPRFQAADLRDFVEESRRRLFGQQWVRSRPSTSISWTRIRAWWKYGKRKSGRVCILRFRRVGHHDVYRWCWIGWNPACRAEFKACHRANSRRCSAIHECTATRTRRDVPAGSTRAHESAGGGRAAHPSCSRSSGAARANASSTAHAVVWPV